MLTNEEIRAIVEAAFKPLRCVAQVWDYEHKLRFKVFDESEKGVLEVQELVLRNLREGPQLEDVVSVARRAVTEKGFRLDPWEPK